jgi:deferrochelatase/peroxidase EfeB
MKNFNDFEFDDLQGLIRFGYGKLTDTSFLLLNVVDSKAAKEWLKKAPVSNAVELDKAPETALQLAFTVQGLRILGLQETAIESFSDEFITGISGDESRSRRLGDIDANSPEHWAWGGKAEQAPHLLLLLYALPGAIDNWQKKVMGKSFSKAFQILSTLPTLDIGPIEPFGFADGISQPVIDWDSKQSTDSHDRPGFSNFMAVGEVVLGYPNEYQQYNARPLMDPKKDKTAEVLANAEDKPDLKDFGRNGSYLVLRQLSQDVPGFWKFVDRAAGSIPEKREQLAAAMVGRNRDGKPLVSEIAEVIPGIPIEDRLNHFNYDEDAGGNQCPIGAHVRRTNPRKGDMPPGDNTLISRLKRLLGFGLTRPDQDLVASSRFHRLLRRGRTYGPILTPEEALKPELPDAERGLQFICLVANIMRQFEFVQNAWVINSKFSGVQQERDPLLGHRQPLINDEKTDQFNRPDPAGPVLKICPLPQFITVRGGGYFFMPSLRALKYIAALPVNGSDRAS